MYDVMVQCEELDAQDAATFRSGGTVMPDAGVVKEDLFAAAAFA